MSSRRDGMIGNAANFSPQTRRRDQPKGIRPSVRDGFFLRGIPGNKLPGLRRAQSSRYDQSVPPGRRFAHSRAPLLVLLELLELLELLLLLIFAQVGEPIVG
jgi:hypothetical protein